jgi:hypothetical protein
MPNDLQVGFIGWAPNYGDPKFTGAAAPPGPGTYETVTIGGPRKRERVIAEIEACERMLAGLLAELATLPT